MMGNDGEIGDDPNARWFEVRKKNRASPKTLSIKASGSVEKVGSPSTCYRDSTPGSFGNLKEIFNSKAVADCPYGSVVSAMHSSPVLAVENQEKEHAIRESEKVKFAGSECQPKLIGKVTEGSNLNLNNVIKIKWGDLDAAALPSSESGNKCISIKEASKNIASGSLEKNGDIRKFNDVGLDAPSCIPVVEECENVVPKGLENLPDRGFSSNELSTEDKCLEYNEILDLSLHGSFDGPPDDSIAKRLEIQSEIALVSNSIILESSVPVAEGTMEPASDDASRPVHGVLNVTELSGTSRNSPTSFAPQGFSEFPSLGSGSGTFTHSVDSASTRYQKELPESLKIGGESGESESDESKERFRERLWCFLFENLNRAVDELYLLCELECDMEQMDEAALVLEEATSDFRELKIRVGKFDIAKRHLCQSKEGSPMTVKADHRRPHALSWEVRRMTTSPHRANILSSSLEAFRKIQLERSNKSINILAKDLDHTKPGQEVPIHSTSEINISSNVKDPNLVVEKDVLSAGMVKTNGEKKNSEMGKGNKGYSVQSGRGTLQGISTSSAIKYRRDPLIPFVEYQKQPPKKDKEPSESKAEKQLRGLDPWKSMDAWKEKRNWEDILKLPMRSSSRVSFPPGINRKSVERARVLHDKLMSPDKKKKTATDLKREAEEKHARAMRIRNQLENERVQRLQRTSEKLNRVNEWQAVRSSKLREIMFARHQRSESLHEAYLAQVVRRAGDESSKVNEVRFITSLNEENKKLMLRQKLHDSEMRRAEKLEVIRTKQKEDIAKEEAVLERRKLLEAEKLQRLAETQRRKEEAQLRREEERKASSAAREAKAVEQLRRKEIRAKAQQEEAEMLAQKLAERLRESEQRRKYYLEQIREKASADFRDQSSPMQRRTVNKESQSKTMIGNNEDNTAPCSSDSSLKIGDATQHQSLKRRIKKIRQRLMALKHDFTEPSIGAENTGVGYRAQMSAARIKIGRWLQELQRFRQARKEGAASIGLIVGDMIKFLDGKDLELHASRRAGILDFISSALPASHTSKPEVCQVTLYLLRLIRVVLSLPANRGYFLAQNLLPPIIPMLSASLENYIKVAASSSSGNTSSSSSKTMNENSESSAEILEGFIWTVTVILGHALIDDRQLQMQDALIELIVAYQVIHRLRDLFALYDRPQVEGSAFPSAILSSLTFLSVLTSRPGTVSSIDWDYCISKAATTNRGQGSKLSNSSVYVNPSRDNTPPSSLCVSLESPANKSAQSVDKEELAGVSPLNLSEDKQPESKDNGKFCSIISVSDVTAVSERHVKALPDESQDISEDIDKCFVAHKDENMFQSEFIERTFDEPAVDDNISSKKNNSRKPPVAFLLSAFTGTGLVSLLSLLTAVLLQANNKLSSEQGSYVLPSNFEEVATDVLKVLNNLANLDISVLQRMLAKPDLKVEFFHLMSFLLTHCSNKWKAANDQVGLLLLESLLLLGYFSLFHPENQAVLRWGKSPTILHKVCDLPFVFFSDPELMPILAGTLVAACYGCEQNRGVVQQELSIDMLLSLLKSCKQGLLSVQLDSSINDSSVLDSSENNQVLPDNRKPQGEIYVKPSRRNSKILTGKGSFSAGNIRVSRMKGQRDCKTKTCEEWALMHNLPGLGSSSTFMLHRRFPTSFLDKSEEFFSAEASSQLK